MIPKKVLSMLSCFSPTTGRRCSWTETGKGGCGPRACCTPPGAPSSPTEEGAVHGLPPMGALLASLSQAIWASNINKSSVRPWSMSHASCDSLCTQGLNTRVHHLPVFLCTSSLQTSASQLSTEHTVPCSLHWLFNGGSCPLKQSPAMQ